MSKGMLKLFMLKIVSEGKLNGYQLMKRVEKVTGKKPSSGSVYPMLMDMEKDGLISANKIDRKTEYSITSLGRKSLDEHNRHKAEYIKMIHASISIANETFDEAMLLEHLGGMYELTAPLVHEVHALLSKGVDASEIIAVLEKAVTELEGLEKEMKK